MAQYRLTGPDGSVYNVTAPDSASQDEVLQQFHANMPAATPAAPQPSKLDAVLDQPILSMGGMSPRRAYNMGMGAIRGAGSIGATLMTPLDAAARALGADPNGSGLGRTDRRQAMTDATQSLGANPQSSEYKIGKLGGETAGTAGAGGALAGVARGLGAAPTVVRALATNGFTSGAATSGARDLAMRSAAGGLAGASQVGLVDPENALVGGAIGAAAPIAVRGAVALGSSLAGAPLSAQRQAAVQSAREAGLVALNSAVEGLSGKIKTAQAASFKNQPVINDLAATDLGLPKGTQITKPILQDIRKEAGQAYGALKNTGTVTADATYSKVLDDAASKYKGVSADFPGLGKSDVIDLVDAMRKDKFTASGAVDAVAVLREKANDAFAQRNTAFGKAAKSIADGIEELLGRHLEATNQDPALIQAFQEARTKIAKSYSVERALNEADGNVSAKALGKQLAKGKPLSGNLETIAKAGQAFPEATQALTRNPGAVSPLDWFNGVLQAKNSLAAGAAALAVRPLARGAILSGPGQNFAAKGKALNALAGPAVYRSLPNAGKQN